MQIDMHYHGTYALARAAGMKAEAAKLVATCAQFVDDAAKDEWEETMGDGLRICSVVTAHHALDGDNLDRKDQRLVWVPFHFLPGNVALTGSMTERYICRADSEVARDMITHALSFATRPFAEHLMGITAHVYADTFSHDGFSGVSSGWNEVEDIAFEDVDEARAQRLHDKVDAFAADPDRTGARRPNIRANIAGGAAQALTGALGHAGAATCPDQPYLRWSFERVRTRRRENRDNQDVFLRGCKALHKMFGRFLAARPDLADPGGARPFSDIGPAVATILAYESEDSEERARQWSEAGRNGLLWRGEGVDIPDYRGEEWVDYRRRLAGRDMESVLDDDEYRFFQAAALHRAYTLRDLLPAERVVVL